MHAEQAILAKETQASPSPVQPTSQSVFPRILALCHTSREWNTPGKVSPARAKIATTDTSLASTTSSTKRRRYQTIVMFDRLKKKKKKKKDKELGAFGQLLVHWWMCIHACTCTGRSAPTWLQINIPIMASTYGQFSVLSGKHPSRRQEKFVNTPACFVNTFSLEFARSRAASHPSLAYTCTAWDSEIESLTSLIKLHQNERRSAPCGQLGAATQPPVLATSPTLKKFWVARAFEVRWACTCCHDRAGFAIFYHFLISVFSLFHWELCTTLNAHSTLAYSQHQHQATSWRHDDALVRCSHAQQ